MADLLDRAGVAEVEYLAQWLRCRQAGKPALLQVTKKLEFDHPGR
jgi:hypothetical protein